MDEFLGWISRHWPAIGATVGIVFNAVMAIVNVLLARSTYRTQRTFDAKSKAKRDACVEALRVAHLNVASTFQLNIKDKDFGAKDLPVFEINDCLNKLLMSVDNPRIIQLYLDVVLWTPPAPSEALEEAYEGLRREVRTEMGFGEIDFRDPDRMIIARSWPKGVDTKAVRSSAP